MLLVVVLVVLGILCLFLANRNLHEYKEGRAIVLGVLAAVMLVLGAVTFNQVSIESTQTSSPAEVARDIGIVLGAGIAVGIVLTVFISPGLTRRRNNRR